MWSRCVRSQMFYCKVKCIRRFGRSLNTESSSHLQLYEVVVVGGGHAGAEAACAAARTGAKTLLLTQDLAKIGEMSCNPSFGGIGKGHLLREIDALDGVCPKVLDESGIQYKILNRSKGPAVWGLRAQVDRSIYKSKLQSVLKDYKNLSLMAATVEDLIIKQDVNCKPQCTGLVLGNGEMITADRVIITTGTFLRGSINLGLEVRQAGRLGDEPSIGLAQTIERIGFNIGRMKTGTPPRLVKSTIDFTKLEKHYGDKRPTPFSFLNNDVWISGEDQMLCHMTYTNERSHKIIRDTSHLNHHIREESGTGPRYCPSIESKVHMFASKSEHQVWLEPEGLDSHLVYPQGMSCTMPPEFQQKLVNTMLGCEKAIVAQPGYGVEYDFIDPRQLRPTLETKLVENLYFAGQINGTTGYEEAASQGLVAGVNAAASLQDRSRQLLIDRTEGYIGVLIDDLTTLGTNEPYRMFTSRAEFRLTLRPDNADIRLTPKGYAAGCVSEERHSDYFDVKRRLQTAVALLKTDYHSGAHWSKLLKLEPKATRSAVNSLFKLLKSKSVTLSSLYDYVPELKTTLNNSYHLEQKLRAEAEYYFVLQCQQNDMVDIRKEAQMLIPESLDFYKIGAVSRECQDVLSQAKPANIAAASRLPGITPSALLQLMIAIRKHKHSLQTVDKITQTQSI